MTTLYHNMHKKYIELIRKRANQINFSDKDQKELWLSTLEKLDLDMPKLSIPDDNYKVVSSDDFNSIDTWTSFINYLSSLSIMNTESLRLSGSFENIDWETSTEDGIEYLEVKSKDVEKFIKLLISKI